MRGRERKLMELTQDDSKLGASASLANTGTDAGDDNDERLVKLLLKWNGENIHIQVKLNETLDDLRALVQMETEVRPENQKIFGLRIKVSVIRREAPTRAY